MPGGSAVHARLTDAAVVAACLADTAAACIVLAGGGRAALYARGGLSGTEFSAGATSPPDVGPLKNGLVSIADARTDARVKTHPWVTGAPFIRFMAVVPLAGQGGQDLGTLYLFDPRRRRLSGEKCAALEAYARQIADTLTPPSDISAGPTAEPQGRAHKSEETLRQLIRNTPVALAMFDREMRYLEASDAWVDAFGMGGAGDIGRSQYELFPDVPERYRLSHQRSLQGEVFRVDEDHWVNRDGSSGWYRWEQRPWYDVAGEIGGIILFAEDITPAKVSASVLRMLSVEGTGLDIGCFLQMCAIRLADILEFDRVHIAQPCADEPGWMQTLALCVNGAEAVNHRYELAGTPCEIALQQGLCLCPDQVQARFPRDRVLVQFAQESYVGLRLLSRDGQLLGVLAASSRRALVDADGVVNALRMAAIGIGAALERHHAAEAINQGVLFNHALLNALTSQIAVLDADGRVIFTNLAWDERLAESACIGGEAMVGTDFVAICDAAAANSPGAAKAAHLLRGVLSGQTAQGSIEIFAEAPAGGRWFKCTIKRFSGPESVHVLVAQEEITEIRQAQRRTDRVQQQFRHLFESAPDAMIMIDQSGRIRLANHRAAGMFGYTTWELANQPVEILLDGPLRDRYGNLRRRFLARARAAATTPIRSARRGRRRDGTAFPIEISLSRFSGGGEEDGDEYVIAAVRDVTMRLQAEADRVAREVAEEASQAKSTFLATMSHEIRTPLSAVLGLAEVLSQSGLSDDQLSQLGSMHDSAGHLLRLIDDVLDFSKIEAGSLEIEEAPVDLVGLIEATARSLANQAAARNVVLHLFVAPELPARVLSDEVRLRQIIYNMLGNAIKFSSGADQKQGRVALRAEVESLDGQPALALTFTDNGIGITPEMMKKLFLPFTQGEGSTTRKFGGTGLGLTICKRIVDRIGGEIAVQSQPGDGACFTVRLPLEVLPSGQAGATNRLAGVTCLLCDSAAFARDDLRRYLINEGAEVVIRGAEAGAAPAPYNRRTVMILGADDPVPSGWPHNLPQVLVGQNGSGRLTIRAPNRILLDAHAMSRQDLANAVALALGQETVAEAALKALKSAAVVPVFADDGAAPLILVAEDDLLNQRVILRQLSLLGLRADTASDGAEALEKWRKGQYALLLTDLHMPVMDGYALAAAIRADEAVGKAATRRPVLALTANALRDEVSRARSMGMDDYLTKPISLARLAEALRPWLPQVRPADVQAGCAVQGAAIDRSAHQDFIGGDAETLHDFLNAYQQMSHELVARFGAAVEAGAHADAAMALHRLKSSSRWIGAHRFGDLCEALEAAANADDGAQLVARLAAFNSLHVSVLDEIRQICSETPGAG